MIWTYCHKITNYEQVDPGTVGLQVGDNSRFLDHRDSDVEDNLADWNNFYAELTGLYYIWKQDTDDYKGAHQYRRWLPLADGLAEGFRVRTCLPLKLSDTLRRQYSTFHSYKDLVQVSEILQKWYPAYVEPWERVLDQNLIFDSNGFAMHREDFDRYCEFLFGVLQHFRELNGWYAPEDVTKAVEREIKLGYRNSVRGVRYQSQIGGFLSERLWTMWVMTNFSPSEVWTDRYVLKENSGI